MKFSSLAGHIQELLGTILRSPKPADVLIDGFFRGRRYLGSHDRRFIAETTYGALRHHRKCRYMLEAAVGSPLTGFPDPDILLLTILTYLLGVERRTPPDVPDIPVPVTKSLRDHLPSILNRISSEPLHLPEDSTERLGVEYSFPDWMVMRFVGEVGEAATPQLLAALNEQAPLTLRVNSLKISAEECRGVLKSQGVETTPATLAPSGLIVGKRINIFQLPAFRDGYFEVQDEGSQMIPLLLDPKPTAKVLDACAGAGGKSLGLSALMKNRGEIMATDIHSFRLDELRKRARRAGAFNIRVVDKDRFDEQADSYERFFDHVLVDAPCSGLGTIRRNPGMKWSVTEETVRELSEKQVSIVSSYLRFLKPGGTLLYATCTFFRQENEEVVERVLALHPEVRRADLGPSADRVGLGSAAAGGVLQLWPHLHGTDGFFCALLSRTE